MSMLVSAVYENGVFRPTSTVGELANGTIVELVVQTPERPNSAAEKRGLTPREIRAVIRSRDPQVDLGPEEWWEEIDDLARMSYSDHRDPEIMRKGAEEMDRLREQIYKREGLLDIAVPLLRESRDEE
jgi:predicted DNA-binding antitoxin AbrB/MazE fold protein